MSSRMTDAWYRAQAKAWTLDPTSSVEVEDDAKVSRNDVPTHDHGAYVQAWVWIADPEGGESDAKRP